MGVSGHMWYSEKIGLKPDILVFRKKAQVSGTVVNERYSECILSPAQKLEVTYDGDLIDAIRASYVLKAYEDDKLIEKVNEKKISSGKCLKRSGALKTQVQHFVGENVAWEKVANN